MRSKSSTAYSEKAPFGLTLGAIGTLLFLHVPLLIIFLYAFTTDEATYTFPLPGLTTKWFGVALGRADLWAALTLSVRVAAVSTLSALILGTLAAAAVYRSNFLEGGISFAGPSHCLPGIVTVSHSARLDGYSVFLWTIAIGHATPRLCL
jgi:putative spermidine/putrescine transport system permease protein